MQGNLYQTYTYYKELAGRYQASSISKNKVEELIQKYENEINKNGVLVRLNQFDLLRAVINDLEDILEEDK